MTDNPYIAAMRAAGFGEKTKKSKKPDATKKEKKQEIKKPLTIRINEAGRKVGASRAETELKLMNIKLKTAEVNYQQLLKDVVLRSDIDKVWNRIYRSASYFADFPSRYAGDWAAALGVSDPEKIHNLERAISEAVELFIADFAESVAGEIK